MTRKNIYIREADLEIWERAKKMAGKNISAFVTTAVRRLVKEQEAIRGLHKRITIKEVFDDGSSTKKSFFGRWLVERLESNDPDADKGWQWSVALTQRGKVAVFRFLGKNPKNCEKARFDYFENVSEAVEAGIPGDILAAATEKLGDDPTIELDI